ncbi:non-homologous end-joining DNA ligase [Pelotomaculum propionicicum]|uniref:non-homologous end-joining DNA ligase n=1 Tax=Pelotomaculum propionicicum TaxID=258475 RepID=UPI003B7BA0F0
MEVLPLLRPMLATSSKPYNSDGHLFEVKWDGYRCLSYLEGNTTVLYSRNGIDLTAKFPELARLHEKVNSAPAILDGEIVVFEEGKPSFAALQSRGRMKDLKTIGRTSLERPAVFVVFDVLYSGGENVMDLPLVNRKELLEEIVTGNEEIVISQFVKKDGLDFYSACVAQGLEGVMAKKLDSSYLPGRRSPYWQKFRHTREADLVICGYQQGSSGRGLGSLVLGGYRDGMLVYQGKVGTGFSEQEAGALLEGLRKLEVAEETLKVPREEKRRTIFVRPLLVCSVEYLTTTNEGFLRHPVYRGIRRDKTPEECPAVERQ